VSDASTDKTDAIVHDYAEKYEFIKLLRITEPHKRNFGAQVDAINKGCELLKPTEYDFIGNLDADISFNPTYFEDLFTKFKADRTLGIGGGWIWESPGAEFKPRMTNSRASVPHGIQMFRRQCFEQIGGYVPLKYGGPDWLAEIQARMHGWKVQSFEDIQVFHNRPTGGGEGFTRAWYRQGRMAYGMGSDPVFEFIKCVRRLRERPYVLGGIVRYLSFVLSYLRREHRLVSIEVAEFLRTEQRQRVRRMFKNSIAPNVANTKARVTTNLK
jgi:glycosyltransferase involved in cell wall biosynthesis